MPHKGSGPVHLVGDVPVGAQIGLTDKEDTNGTRVFAGAITLSSPTPVAARAAWTRRGFAERAAEAGQVDRPPVRPHESSVAGHRQAPPGVFAVVGPVRPDGWG
jgi:hypothetical protein